MRAEWGPCDQANFLSDDAGGDHVLSKLDLLFAGAALAVVIGGARAGDAKYPSWKGQWNAIVTPGLIGAQFKFDPTKDRGIGQQAPLTPEYQAVHQDSMADQARGGLCN